MLVPKSRNQRVAIVRVRGVGARKVVVRTEDVVVINFMKRFYIFALSICIFASGCASKKSLPSKETDAPRKQAKASFTLSQSKLLDIIKAQEELFSDPNILEMGIHSQSELNSRATRVNSMWKTYFLSNPNDVEALVLYGKFLRKIGKSAMAYETFKQADKLNGSLAVVKQQLSAIEAEEAQVENAFKHIREALDLEPNNPIYLKQTAYIMVVAKKDIVGKIISAEQFDEILTHCYKIPSEQNPTNREAKLRYAQSFYDLHNPDWNTALSLWKEVLEMSSLNLEIQIAKANMARVLVELNRDEEASVLLKDVDASSLQRAKMLLLKEIKSGNSRLEKGVK